MRQLIWILSFAHEPVILLLYFVQLLHAIEHLLLLHKVQRCESCCSISITIGILKVFVTHEFRAKILYEVFNFLTFMFEISSFHSGVVKDFVEQFVFLNSSVVLEHLCGVIKIEEFLAHVCEFAATDVFHRCSCLGANMLINFVKSLGVVHRR